MSDDTRPESAPSADEGAPEPRNFVQQIIDEHGESGRFGGRVHTRFPPEPNGYLHVGHVKAICLNFGLAEEYGGQCNLRFDDTNPSKEEQEYVDSIQADVRWLGFDWEDRLYYASGFFQELYDFAEKLIREGKAYVESLSAEEVREHRGGWNAPGKESPYRDRSPEENLDLFRRMKAGEFDEGTHTLRAKIDMSSSNMNMRDPTLYRILKAAHHRTGEEWCIYPMYDWAHGQCDSLEDITHSICTLEFEGHRPLYDWCLEALEIHHPQQIEFARLEMTYTVLSKRKLLKLVDEGHCRGWDDPRMPTIRGLRRRGYTAEALRAFCKEIGVAKFNSTIDVTILENALRTDLNRRANRVLGVLRPVKLVIDNFPEGEVQWLDAINNPEDESAGTRKLPFTKELWIEEGDFREEAPRKFFRMVPGREVRLRYGFFVTCTGCVKNESGEVVEVHGTYDPETLGGQAPDGRKVKGTIHWVSAEHAVDAEVRLYDHLFVDPDPNKAPEGKDFLHHLNPDSLETLEGCKLEASLAEAGPEERFQFERNGYFCVDAVDSAPGALVFNRTVTLRDTWAKKSRGA